jgi:hypothetical protein
MPMMYFLPTGAKTPVAMRKFKTSWFTLVFENLWLRCSVALCLRNMKRMPQGQRMTLAK